MTGVFDGILQPSWNCPAGFEWDIATKIFIVLFNRHSKAVTEFSHLPYFMRYFDYKYQVVHHR